MGTIEKPPISIIDAVNDENLFAPWFKESYESYKNWFVFLKAVFNLPMTNTEKDTFFYFTGRTQLPQDEFLNADVCVGRRGGKTSTTSLIAAFIATMYDYSKYSRPGENLVLPVLSVDQKAAQSLYKYIAAFFQEIPLLQDMVVRFTADTIELNNGVSIMVRSASFRGLRGPTFVSAILDEAAFFATAGESNNSDSEIIQALKPGMSTIPMARLILISSPYAKRGEFYKHYKEYYGSDSNYLLFWKGASWEMNPTLPSDYLEQERKKDPAAFVNEYQAEFRDDIAMLVSPEVVEDCVMDGVYEMQPDPTEEYIAFVDASGGSSDSFTLCIAYIDREGTPTQAYLKEIEAPFNPEQATFEIVQDLRRFGIREVTGDRYSGHWIQSAFDSFGIEYKFSSRTKSDIYLEALPILNSKSCNLLDNDKQKNQMISLERKSSGSNRKEIVDHPRNGHDDLVNSGLGALVLANEGSFVDEVMVW